MKTLIVVIMLLATSVSAQMSSEELRVWGLTPEDVKKHETRRGYYAKVGIGDGGGALVIIHPVTVVNIDRKELQKFEETRPTEAEVKKLLSDPKCVAELKVWGEYHRNRANAENIVIAETVEFDKLTKCERAAVWANLGPWEKDEHYEQFIRDLQNCSVC